MRTIFYNFVQLREPVGALAGMRQSASLHTRSACAKVFFRTAGMAAFHPTQPVPTGIANGRHGAGRAVPNSKLSDREGWEADLSTQARVKAACEFTAQPKLGNGRGALERWPRKQALTIGRGAGTEQRGEVALSHVIERIADRNVGKRHPPRHQEVATLQPLLE